MATAAASNVENPKQTLVQSLPPDPNQKAKTESQIQSSIADAAAPPSNLQQTSSGGGEEKKAVPSTGANSETDGTVNGDDAPVTDIQKKMRRAERFGLSVQLSEEEKRNSRAERYSLLPSSALIFNLKPSILRMPSPVLSTSQNKKLWEGLNISHEVGGRGIV